MVKEPRPGRVKTRLARDIGSIDATWWFRHQTNRLLRRLTDPRWKLVLAVSPDHRGAISRAWPIELPRISQGRGDLGDRMARIMRNMPPGPICIIGADIPEIKPRHIEQAFRSLGRNEVTFGPAPDGGFWLVGMKRTARIPRSAFANVRWSTEHALEDTKRSMAPARIGFVETLNDVDTAKDLGRCAL